jgi:outer membrane lipoprotein-sorting protein
MHKMILTMAGLLVALLLTGPSYGRTADANGPAGQTTVKDPNELDTVLKNLQQKAAELNAYQARIDYVVRQPLLESQQRRTGTLYYAKLDKRSFLRIDFATLQQDEEKEQKWMEQFLFDGVWLWHVDYQTKHVERRQMAEPNRAVDALALASRHLPVVGFSKVEDLQKEFEVQLVAGPPEETAALRHLHLTVRPDSVYKDDYVTIDFWIDRKIGLPIRVAAATTEEEVHEIKLLDPRVNTVLERKTFQVEIPKGFSVEVIPLEKRKARP